MQGQPYGRSDAGGAPCGRGSAQLGRQGLHPDTGQLMSVSATGRNREGKVGVHGEGGCMETTAPITNPQDAEIRMISSGPV
ncbi:hypothetical protein Scani_71700 [Streptomyces caniferus]|uniref:Uncharacterized protein n=1 Tax=Streptomyces caniferus TaxID=285557 RepID=A0A640SJL6_9ACTN|nr:hypothetical protein Scani_71700 [Streptomyces caniferus]